MKCICLADNVIDYYQNTGEMFPGGNAVNVAVHLAKQCGGATYFGNIANDEMGKVIIQALMDNSVDYDHCNIIDGASTKYCLYDVVDGERTFIKVELGNNWQGPMILNQKDVDYISRFDAVISSCNSKMENEMNKISSLNNLFIYDFGEKEKYRVDEYLEKVCPNLDLAMFSCSDLDEKDIVKLCKRVSKKGALNILVTMGRRGQYLYNRDNIIHHTVKFVDAVDTMGAGDSFLAAFISRMNEQGWIKGEIISPTKATKVLEAASDYSMRNCLIEGAFGHKVEQ